MTNNKLISIILIIVLGLDAHVHAAPTRSGAGTESFEQTGAAIDDVESVIRTKLRQVVTVGEVSRASRADRPFFIHVRDLHCNDEAQLNIAKTLEGLVRAASSSGVEVLTEGAEGRVDTSFFGTFPERHIRTEASRAFMKEGKLTGPEYLSISRYGEFPLNINGVEDADLYAQNFKVFREVLGKSGETGEWVRDMDEMMDQLKKAAYSKELLELDEKERGFRTGTAKFEEYVQFLNTQDARRKTLDSSESYPNFVLLLKILEGQKTLDLEKVEAERTQVMNELAGKLPKEDLGRLIKGSLEFRLGKVSAQDYFGTLWKTAGDHLDVRLFGNLAAYVALVDIQGRIDHDGLMKEVDRMTHELRELLLKTGEERVIHALDRDFGILKKMLRLEMSREDLAYYRENKLRCSVEAVWKRLNDLVMKRSLTLARAAGDASKLKFIAAVLGEGDEFYNLALKRDEMMVAKAEETYSRLPPSASRLSVFITGGFHSEGVTELLKRKDIAYIVLTPRVSGEPDMRKYHELMLDERVSVQAIAFFSIFNEAVARRLSAPMQQDLLKEFLEDMLRLVEKQRLDKEILETWVSEREGRGEAGASERILLAQVRERILPATVAAQRQAELLTEAQLEELILKSGPVTAELTVEVVRQMQNPALLDRAESLFQRRLKAEGNDEAVSEPEQPAAGRTVAAQTSSPGSWLAPDLMEEFTKMNGGRPVKVFIIQGDYADTLGQLGARLEGLPDDEMVMIELESRYPGRVDRRIVVDRAGFLRQRAGNLWMGNVALMEYEFLLDFSAYEGPKTIHLHDVSLGKEFSEDLQGRGLMSKTFQQFVDFLRKGYAGWTISTVALSDIVAHWLKKYFGAHFALSDQEFSQVRDYVYVDPVDIGRIMIGRVGAGTSEEDEPRSERTAPEESGEQGRGYEGLPNDTYTQGIRDALFSADFGAFQLNGSGQAVAVDFFTDQSIRNSRGETRSAGRIPAAGQKIKLSEGERALLGAAVRELGLEQALAGTNIIFIRAQQAHYGLGRNQIYLDAALLNDPEQLKRELYHEAVERHEVLAGLSNNQTLWNEFRNTALWPERRSQRLRDAIGAFAGAAHVRLEVRELAQDMVSQNVEILAAAGIDPDGVEWMRGMLSEAYTAIQDRAAELAEKESLQSLRTKLLEAQSYEERARRANHAILPSADPYGVRKLELAIAIKNLEEARAGRIEPAGITFSHGLDPLAVYAGILELNLAASSPAGARNVAVSPAARQAELFLKRIGLYKMSDQPRILNSLAQAVASTPQYAKAREAKPAVSRPVQPPVQRQPVQLPRQPEVMERPLELSRDDLRSQEVVLNLANADGPKVIISHDGAQFLVRTEGGSALSVGPDGIVVGRSPASRLQILNQLVSREHVKITINAQGLLVVENLSQTNPTFVRAEPVARDQRFQGLIDEVRQAMSSGDFARLAHAEQLILQLEAQGERITARQLTAELERAAILAISSIRADSSAPLGETVRRTAGRIPASIFSRPAVRKALAQRVRELHSRSRSNVQSRQDGIAPLLLVMGMFADEDYNEIERELFYNELVRDLVNHTLFSNDASGKGLDAQGLEKVQGLKRQVETMNLPVALKNLLLLHLEARAKNVAIRVAVPLEDVLHVRSALAYLPDGMTRRFRTFIAIEMEEEELEGAYGMAQIAATMYGMGLHFSKLRKAAERNSVKPFNTFIHELAHKLSTGSDAQGQPVMSVAEWRRLAVAAGFRYYIRDDGSLIDLADETSSSSLNRLSLAEFRQMSNFGRWIRQDAQGNLELHVIWDEHGKFDAARRTIEDLERSIARGRDRSKQQELTQKLEAYKRDNRRYADAYERYREAAKRLNTPVRVVENPAGDQEYWKLNPHESVAVFTANLALGMSPFTKADTPFFNAASAILQRNLFKSTSENGDVVQYSFNPSGLEAAAQKLLRQGIDPAIFAGLAGVRVIVQQPFEALVQRFGRLSGVQDFEEAVRILAALDMRFLNEDLIRRLAQAALSGVHNLIVKGLQSPVDGERLTQTLERLKEEFRDTPVQAQVEAGIATVFRNVLEPALVARLAEEFDEEVLRNLIETYEEPKPNFRLGHAAIFNLPSPEHLRYMMRIDTLLKGVDHAGKARILRDALRAAEARRANRESAAIERLAGEFDAYLLKILADFYSARPGVRRPAIIPAADVFMRADAILRPFSEEQRAVLLRAAQEARQRAEAERTQVDIVAPVWQSQTVGGNRSGGHLEIPTFSAIWIRAGSFAYRLELAGNEKDGYEIVFQRFSGEDRVESRSSEGTERRFPVQTVISVGSDAALGNLYFLGRDLDPGLSGKHFAANILRKRDGQMVWEISDENSTNGTRVEWIGQAPFGETKQARRAEAEKIGRDQLISRVREFLSPLAVQGINAQQAAMRLSKFLQDEILPLLADEALRQSAVQIAARELTALFQTRDRRPGAGDVVYDHQVFAKEEKEAMARGLARNLGVNEERVRRFWEGLDRESVLGPMWVSADGEVQASGILQRLLERFLEAAGLVKNRRESPAGDRIRERLYHEYTHQILKAAGEKLLEEPMKRFMGENPKFMKAFAERYGEEAVHAEEILAKFVSFTFTGQDKDLFEDITSEKDGISSMADILGTDVLGGAAFPRIVINRNDAGRVLDELWERSPGLRNRIDRSQPALSLKKIMLDFRPQFVRGQFTGDFRLVQDILTGLIRQDKSFADILVGDADTDRDSQIKRLKALAAQAAPRINYEGRREADAAIRRLAAREGSAVLSRWETLAGQRLFEWKGRGPDQNIYVVDLNSFVKKTAERDGKIQLQGVGAGVDDALEKLFGVRPGTRVKLMSPYGPEKTAEILQALGIPADRIGNRAGQVEIVGDWAAGGTLEGILAAALGRERLDPESRRQAARSLVVVLSEETRKVLAENDLDDFKKEMKVVVGKLGAEKGGQSIGDILGLALLLGSVEEAYQDGRLSPELKPSMEAFIREILSELLADEMSLLPEEERASHLSTQVNAMMEKITAEGIFRVPPLTDSLNDMMREIAIQETYIEVAA